MVPRMDRKDVKEFVKNLLRMGGWPNRAVTSGEYREQGVGQVGDVANHCLGSGPAQGGHAGHRVDHHQSDVDRQYQLHATAREREMRTSIKGISGKSSDGHFYQQERSVAG